MRHSIYFILLLFFACHAELAWAQLHCKTRKSNDSTITTCLHANKRISSREVWDPQNRWGMVTCFNQQGKKLLEWHTRKVGGHASVYLKYFPNGQVSRADYSSHPDGGIQWHKETMTFDESGKVTSHTREGTDDMGRPTLMPRYMPTHDSERIKPFVKPAPKQEVMACAEIYFSILQMENNTPNALQVDVAPRFRHKEKRTFILSPGAVVRVDSLMLAQYFEEPDKQLEVKVQWQKPKRKGNLMIEKQLPVTLSKQKTLYRWRIKPI